jgi:hypothetical protein
MFHLLKLLMTVARMAARAEALRVAVARAAMAFAVILIAFTLGIGGLGFGLYAAFIYLAQMAPPAAAAAIIAAALFAAATGMVAIAWHLVSAPKGRRKAPQAGAPADEHGLASLVRLLDGWARANPWEATVAALTIGFTIGSRR